MIISELYISVNSNWTEGTKEVGKLNIFLSGDPPAASPPTLPDYNHDPVILTKMLTMQTRLTLPGKTGQD